MSGKKTLIIFIIFAIAAGVYFWDQKRVTEKTTREEAESRLVTPEQKDVTEVTVTAGSDTSKLKKEGEAWTLAAPIKARTDRSTVDALLGELDRAKKKDPFDVTDATLKDYGLDKPTVTADVQASKQNYIQKFAIGANTPDGGEVYVRVGDEKKVYTLPISLKNSLSKTTLDLRDKRLIPATPNDATRLSIVSTTSTLEVAKTSDTWRLVKPVAGKADQTKITDLLNELNTAKRSDFVASPSTHLVEYGLDHPVWTATLYVAGTDPRTSATTRTLKIGGMLPSDSTKRYATLEGEPDIFAVPDTVLAKGTPKLDELRAKELFSITSADAGRITFGVRGKQLAVERDSAGQWRFAGEPDTKLDQAVVTNKVNDLLAMKAQRFLTSEPLTTLSGLDDPNLRLSVANKAGTTTETVITGRKSDSEDIVYAAVPAIGQYLALDWREPGKFFITREELIDKSLFSFTEDAATKIDLTDGSKTLTLEKDGTTWQANANGKKTQIDGPKVTALLYGLTGLSWDRTLNPRFESEAVLIKTQQLEKPAREIVVHDKDKVELARLGFGGEEVKYAYVRKGNDQYYAIDKMKLSSLTDSMKTLFTPAAPEPSKKD